MKNNDLHNNQKHQTSNSHPMFYLDEELDNDEVKQQTSPPPPMFYLDEELSHDEVKQSKSLEEYLIYSHMIGKQVSSSSSSGNISTITTTKTSNTTANVKKDIALTVIPKTKEKWQTIIKTENCNNRSKNSTKKY